MSRHYEEVENMSHTMWAWQHDYHNHIQAANSYLELKKYYELAVYLKQLDESLHGFGLTRVTQIVEKYCGFLDCQSEEDVFATEVLLPRGSQGTDM